ncbi:MAG: hypothetical protein Q9M97_03075 [Candidatus Gracilibacteria bacterium]|nr:hypothetical protein [Candidatus Gracilibacteria bacterium]
MIFLQVYYGKEKSGSFKVSQIAKIHEAISSINQVIYKISNAMSINFKKTDLI